MRALTAFLVTLCCSSASAVEPPTMSRIFPLGGQRGTEVQVTIKGKFGDGDVNIWCNNQGINWSKAEPENTLTATIAEDAPLGLSYLRLWNKNGVSELKPFVVGAIPEAQEQEPNDRTSEPNTIAASPSLINGVLEKRGDVDHFQLDLAAGETLVASVQAERELKSEADVTLQLTDLQGNVIAENLDYHGLDPQIVWTSPSDQSIILRIFGFPANPNSTIALAGGDNFIYRLTVTKGPWCEGVLPLAISTEMPTPFAAFGWNLTDANSITIAAESLPHNTHAIHADRLQTIHVAGSPNSFLLPTTLLPTISISRQQTDNDNLAQQVDVPVVVSGNICEPNQVDVIEFSTTKDSQWNLVLESRQLGFPLDAVLTIEDAESGKQLSQVDDVNRQADPIVAWKAPADGRYRVKIADINGSASENNLYRLWIKPQHPEVRVSVSQSAFTGEVGQALEIPIKIERLSGFDQPLDFELESPVEGLEFVPATSEPTGDSSKEVKLKLTSTTPIVQSFKIRAKYQQATQQMLRPVLDASTGVGDLWITFK